MIQALIQADAREVPLADGSVQCIITSIPYWGLRDYGLQPSVWGGTPGCAHEFQSEIVIDRRGVQIDPSGTITGPQIVDARKSTRGSLCHCGAWRGCLGLEPTPELFVQHVVEVFEEARRVLRPDGVLFLNIGDSYNANQKGSDGGRSTLTKQAADAKRLATTERFRERRPLPTLKPKDRVGIPHLVVFALRAAGWYWRDEVVWSKPNPMPESVRDRTTKAHEFIFVLSKSPRYFYDADAIREPVTSTGGASFGKQNHATAGTLAQSRALKDPSERNHPLGRNKRSVWTITTQSCPEAHFATFPVRLPTLCIKAGTSEKGCCPKCAAPWLRQVERVKAKPLVPSDYNGKHLTTDPQAPGRRMLASQRARRLAGLPHDQEFPTPVTVSWKPSCACNAGDPVPCIVLDNFHGAGTTAIAAEHLGRSYVGIERKHEYVVMSRARIERFRDKRKNPKRKRLCAVAPDQHTLFPISEAS